MKELNSTADLHQIEWLLSHMKGNKLYMTSKHTGLEIQALIIIDDENFFICVSFGEVSIQLLLNSVSALCTLDTSPLGWKDSTAVGFCLARS